MKAQFFPLGDRNPTKKFPYLTVFLIIVNVIIFIWSMTNFETIIFTFGFIPLYPSIITIFTSMFLHGGIDHIFGNMWYLWIFGDNVEDKFGRAKFFLIYILSGLAATFAHFITNIGSEIPTIGASGAISGILGSYLVLFPRTKIHTRYGLMPAYSIIGFWFVIQLIFGAVSFMGFAGSGIAFWAHVGGFIFGFVATKATTKNKNRKFES